MQQQKADITQRHNHYKLSDKTLHLELFTDRSGDCTWIPIPKNGYKVIKRLVKRHSYDQHYWHPGWQPTPQQFVVIRNPITRLFSALEECRYRIQNQHIHNLNWPDLLDAFHQDPSQFDEHCEPQCYYLHGFRPTRWIRYNHMEENFGMWNQFPHTDMIDQSRADVSKSGDPWELYGLYRQQVNRILNTHWACDVDLWHNPLGSVDTLL